MGLMRLWLALAVVAGHGAPTAGLRFFDPTAAVLGFYVISGFYMSLVLETRYAGRLGSFYFNRALRIYPSYLAVLVLAAALQTYFAHERGMMSGPYVTAFIDGVRPARPALLASALAQLGILGQDLCIFFSVGPSGALQFQPDSYFAKNALWHFNFLPQAWTLAIELLFYLLAPLVVKAPSRALALAFFLGLALRLALGLSGLSMAHPWTARFAPLDLTVFCGGILAWRLGQSAEAVQARRLFPALLLVALFLLPYLVSLRPLQEFTVPLAMLALLPLIGAARGGRFERFAGELSYPLYICHASVFIAFSLFLGRTYQGPWLLPTCLAAAALLHVTLERPLRRLRAPAG